MCVFHVSERRIFHICLGPRTVALYQRLYLGSVQGHIGLGRCLAWARHAAPPGWELLRLPPELICTFMSRLEDGFSFCWKSPVGLHYTSSVCPKTAAFCPGRKQGRRTHVSVLTPPNEKRKTTQNEFCPTTFFIHIYGFSSINNQSSVADWLSPDSPCHSDRCHPPAGGARTCLQLKQS